MNLFQIIDTPRLRLRSLLSEGASDYHALESDVEVKEFLNGPTKRDAEYYRAQIAKQGDRLATTLAVCLKDTGQFIGRCGFTDANEDIEWEFNIVLAKNFWGKGYAEEIAKALIPTAFQLVGCSMIHAVVDVKNARSIKLCEALGMTAGRELPRYQGHARVYTISKAVIGMPQGIAQSRFGIPTSCST
jgi:RimJ/RimL family protein N-acetyltransferase